MSADSAPILPPDPQTSTLPSGSRFPMGRGEFITLLAMLMSLQALATDAMLPALGAIARDLGEPDPNRRQLVVGVFLLASGMASLLPGALADRFGRRRVALVCLSFYVAFALGCALVQDFAQLLVMRVLLGVACSGLVVLPGAIVRDRYAGDAMARMMSTISATFMIVPILAPSMGQVVLSFAGWRAIFVALALLAGVMTAWTFLRLPETLHPEHRRPIRPASLLDAMRRATFNRLAVGYVFGSALVFGAMLGYINSSQQLVAEHFGAGPLFPLLFAASAVAMAAASLTNARIVERFGARRVSHTALLVFIASAGLQLWLASRPNETLWQFMPVMALNLCLLGFLGANFSSIALQPFGEIAGAAASAQSFVRMATGAGLGIVIGNAFDGSARPLAGWLLTCGMVCLGLILISENGRLFRRLYPAGTPRPVADALPH